MTKLIGDCERPGTRKTGDDHTREAGDQNKKTDTQTSPERSTPGLGTAS